MVRPEFGPDNHRPAEPMSETKAPPEAPDASVLETILRQTLSSDKEPLSEETMASLRQLARRYAGQPFNLEPQGVELVSTLLRDRLLDRRISSDAFAEVSREVATSLFEVPEVWQRAERLWRNLSETSS